MTTKHSPLHVLNAQADKIAATIKAAERGEKSMRVSLRGSPPRATKTLLDRGAP